MMLENFEPLIFFEGEAAQQAYYFAFRGREILVDNTGGIAVPLLEAEVLVPLQSRQLYLGRLSGTDCFAVEIRQDSILPGMLELIPLRTALINLPQHFGSLANRAVQFLDWDRDHQYCGRCSQKMMNVPNERSKKCPVCGLVNYPRISPAIIVLIHKGDEVLLTRSPHFKPGIFSVQAGFVEAGESLEDTVRREIFEETGLKVKDITYFGSQPWPFPNSLMTAFTATYDSGELVFDPVEIEAGGWYNYNELPTIPDGASISRKLIDWFTESRKNRNI